MHTFVKLNIKIKNTDQKLKNILRQLVAVIFAVNYVNKLTIKLFLHFLFC